MNEFYLKKGDLLPKLRATLLDADGTAIDISGASATFSMKNASTGALKINAAVATVADAVNGVVEYPWAGTDTDTVGTYYGEFVLTFPGGKKQTVPNYQFIKIYIQAGV